jgi:hypothetical protein
MGHGHVLIIDRSARGIALTQRNLAAEIEAGLVSLRNVAAEDFVLERDERPYDLAFAVRVGAFDGRHPRAGERARARIAAALVPGGSTADRRWLTTARGAPRMMSEAPRDWIVFT